MKKFLTISGFILALSAGNLFAATPIEPVTRDIFNVGNQPAGIFYGNIHDNSQDIYVVCTGNDSDWDGMQGEGEEVPSLWRINVPYPFDATVAKEEPTKILEFPFQSLKYTFRATIDTTSKNLYLLEGSNLVAYNYETLEKTFEMPVEANSMTCYVENDAKIAYVSGGNWGEPGFVKKYDLATSTLLETIATGFYTRQSLPYNSGSLAVMNEADGNIMFFDVSGETATLMSTLELGSGSTCNHMTICDDIMYVTNNGNHKIVMIDLATREITHEIAFPTMGYDGPRESSVALDRTTGKHHIMTTAFAGNLYLGYVEDLIEDSGKWEYYAEAGKTETVVRKGYNEEPTYISLINDAYYAPENKIIRYGTTAQSGVNEVRPTVVSAYPCPAVNEVTLNLYAEEGQNANVEVLSTDGRRVASINTSIFDGKIKFNAADYNMAAGSYMINVSTGDKKFSSKVIIK